MRQALEKLFAGRSADPLRQIVLLLILPELRDDPPSRAMIEIAAALSEAGGKALVASEGGPLVSELQAKGGIWIPFPASTRNPLAMGLNMRRLGHLIESESVDIIHARSRAPSWVACGAAYLTKTFLVTNFQDMNETSSRLKLRYNSVMAKGNCIIAESKFAASRITKLYPHAKGKIFVIPPGCDLRQFSLRGLEPRKVQELRVEWKVAPDERIVLLPGTFGPGEGQELLIESAGILTTNGLAGVKFILTGDIGRRAAKTAELTKLVEKANLQKLVSFHPSPIDRPAAILSAAAVVFPATQAQVSNQASIETQAMGTPLIVADIGALPETVLAPPDADAVSRTGWRIPANDPMTLANAIGTVLSLGASARDSLSQRARVHIEKRYSRLTASTETLRVYLDLLNRPK